MPEQLSGAIERITFHNLDNGYCVLRVQAEGHRELITVVGNPTGFSFPSTTITFFCATFGTLAVLSARKAATPLNAIVLVAASAVLTLGGVARVALGLHWPSDVAFTSVICLTWLWATARVAVPR